MNRKAEISTFRLLSEVEGCRLKPYLCSAGVPTIGLGNTYYEDGKKVTLADKPITVERAEQLFYNIAKEKGTSVNKLVKTELTQYQWDVALSLCWQYGAGWLAKSLFLKQINKDPKDSKAIRKIFDLMEYQSRRATEFLHYV